MKYLGAPQSGSQANTTASRNRYGQYYRNRATPVNPHTSLQGTVRARLALSAAGWRMITAAQRAGWGDLALNMPRTDSLGQSSPITGFQAYCSVNNNNLAAGNPVVADAPILTTPTGLTTAVVTLSAAAFSVAFTVTPLPAGTRLLAYCSPQRSAGRNYESDLRLISVSSAALASPFVILAPYTARFGVPITGNRIFMRFKTYTGGFLSGPLDMSQVVS